MKRLIVKYNRVIRREEMDKIEAKAQKEWKEKEAVFIPECCDYEIIDDGVNEAAIWLDQEIEKRKAAAAEEEYYKETCESLQKTIVKLNETVQEQGLKLKEYEKAAVSKQISPTDEIIVGDEVRHFNSLGVVVKATNYSTCVLTIDRNYITVDKMNLEKTGRNFPQIEEVLEQIRNEDRQSED